MSLMYFGVREREEKSRRSLLSSWNKEERSELRKLLNWEGPLPLSFSSLLPSRLIVRKRAPRQARLPPLLFLPPFSIIIAKIVNKLLRGRVAEASVLYRLHIISGEHHKNRAEMIIVLQIDDSALAFADNFRS